MPLDETSHEKKTALMALRVQCLSIDTHDPLELADFWQEALGWRRTHEAPPFSTATASMTGDRRSSGTWTDSAKA